MEISPKHMILDMYEKSGTVSIEVDFSVDESSFSDVVKLRRKIKEYLLR